MRGALKWTNKHRHSPPALSFVWRSRVQERQLIDSPSRLFAEITAPCLCDRLIRCCTALESASGPSIRPRGRKTETRSATHRTSKSPRNGYSWRAVQRSRWDLSKAAAVGNHNNTNCRVTSPPNRTNKAKKLLLNSRTICVIDSLVFK